MWHFLLLALISFGSLTSDKAGSGKPPIKFSINGEIKIVQFTDLHFDILR